jgi:hypothetical protein
LFAWRIVRSGPDLDIAPPEASSGYQNADGRASAIEARAPHG